MTPRKIPSHRGGSARRISSGPARLRMMLALPAAAAVAAALAACGSAAAGVTGTFGTITRSDDSIQATFDGHPLYTFVGDTAPGQAKGNGLNVAGGLWHEITASGAAAPAGGASSGSGGGGYGY